MTRQQLLLTIIVLGLGQLAWLISTWRRHGVGAAVRLFLYGVLSSAIYALSDAAAP